MRKTTMPESKRDCLNGCGKLLRYYMEAPVTLDLYFCEKCYIVHEFDGENVRKTEIEAYPNRDKTTTPTPSLRWE